MSSTPDRIEIITSAQRRRRWSPCEKVQIVEGSFEPGSTVGLVTRLSGVAPTQPFTCRLAAQGARTAAGAEEEVVPASEYRALQN